MELCATFSIRMPLMKIPNFWWLMLSDSNRIGRRNSMAKLKSNLFKAAHSMWTPWLDNLKMWAISKAQKVELKSSVCHLLMLNLKWFWFCPKMAAVRVSFSQIKKLGVNFFVSFSDLNLVLNEELESLMPKVTEPESLQKTAATITLPKFKIKQKFQLKNQLQKVLSWFLQTKIQIMLFYRLPIWLIFFRRWWISVG